MIPVLHATCAAMLLVAAFFFLASDASRLHSSMQRALREGREWDDPTSIRGFYCAMLCLVAFAAVLS